MLKSIEHNISGIPIISKQKVYRFNEMEMYHNEIYNDNLIF